MVNKKLLIIGAGLAVAAFLLYRKNAAASNRPLTSQYGNGQTTDPQDNYYKGLDWDWGQFGKPSGKLTYA